MRYRTHRTKSAGFTLAETLITIALTAMLLAVYLTILSSMIFMRRTQYDMQAANLIQEELEVLRALPYAELLNRTDGDFLGIPVQRGGWTVETIETTKALDLGETQTAAIEETGLAIVPGNYREDFTMSTEVRISSSSPAGWGGGIVFRYKDAENHYRFRFASGGIALDKIYQGAKTTVWSQGETYSEDIWYTLEVIASSDSFTLKRDGVTLTTQTDATFTSGDLGLIALNGGLTAFDDVSVTEGATTTWDFESDDTGEIPNEWMRRSFADLPGGTGALTIEDYLSDADIKQVTVTITWRDGLFTKTRTGMTLITD